MPNRIRTVFATELVAGDEIYLDTRMTVQSVEDGLEPTFAPGETVTIVRGVNAFGTPVAKWTRRTSTFRVTR